MKKTVFVTMIVLLAVCGTILMTQGICRDRRQARLRSLFEKAAWIQRYIDMLESDGAPRDKITVERKALSVTMDELDQAFDRDVTPKWLQIWPNLGVLLGIIVMWKMKKKDTVATKIPDTCDS